jgi:AcrR family transcriptional regulator
MTPASETKDTVLERFRAESITEGALRAIARKGASVTMQDIADESGISKGTLYLYFKDREELLHRVSEGAVSQLILRLEGVFARALPFEETIRELVLTKLRFFDERRDLFRVNYEMRFPNGRDPHCVAPRSNPAERQVYLERLTRYLAANVENPEDAPRLALFLSEAVIAVLVRRIPEPEGPKLENDAQFLSDLLLNGLSGRRKKS